jgi:hypothetical protein
MNEALIIRVVTLCSNLVVVVQTAANHGFGRVPGSRAKSPGLCTRGMGFRDPVDL